MNSELIAVSTFQSEPEAQIAKGILDEAGIESMIRSDNAGGMYPALAGVELLVTRAGAVPVKAKIDNNGRWLDRLGASVAHDGSWVRFHVSDPRGAAAGRYQFSNVAFVDARDGTLIRTTVTNSTDEERATLFGSSATLAEAQTVRGREVTWRPCS